MNSISELAGVGRPRPLGRELHLVMNNYAAHKTPDVKDWLCGQPADPCALQPDLRILAESRRSLVWDHERQAIRRGTFT